MFPSCSFIHKYFELSSSRWQGHLGYVWMIRSRVTHLGKLFSILTKKEKKKNIYCLVFLILKCKRFCLSLQLLCWYGWKRKRCYSKCYSCSNWSNHIAKLLSLKNIFILTFWTSEFPKPFSLLEWAMEEKFSLASYLNCVNFLALIGAWSL